MAAPREGGRTQGNGLIDWRCVAFDELTPRELHDVLQLRAAVFVVEQTCPFQDVDGAARRIRARAHGRGDRESG